jgi:DNA repair protein REV1
MLNATQLPDVLDTITKWVESRGGKGPAERDAKKVEAYLVKLMEPGAGLGGVEAAIECLKWMEVILGERWKDEAMETGGDFEVGEKDRKAGKEWWDTWRRFLGSISKRCEETMGAPIRL